MVAMKADFERFNMIKSELFTAVVGDIMDKMGYCRQFLPAAVKPLREDMVVVGRAMPVLETDVAEYGHEAVFV